MSNCNILVIETDEAIREMLVLVLEQANFIPKAVDNVVHAQTLLDNKSYDLILLDWRFNGGAGVEWAMRLKKDPVYKEIPIVFLITRGEEDFIINSLDVGADDYITKAFSPKELIARLRIALLRCGKNQQLAQVKLGDITLDTEQRRFCIGDQWLDVGPTRFKIMHFFMTHPDKVYTRDQLMDYIWGRRIYIEERTVDVHIRRLRKSLEELGRADLVQTVRGQGYRFSLAA